MWRSRIGSHLREIFRWSSEGRIGKAEILAAALGMAVPVLVGVLSGHPAPGFAAALGALAVGRIEAGTGTLACVKRVFGSLAPLVLAALLALAVAGHGWWTSAALVLVSGIAATIGGFSRPMVVGAARFVLFLMIVGAAPAQAPLQAAAFLAFVASGALWTSVLGLAFGAAAPAPASRGSGAGATIRQKYARWKRSLGTIAGWSYPLRLVLCLAVAAAMDLLWPGHHLHWIGLTVAILTPRHVDRMPARTTQRALGTALGVGAAGIALRSELSGWAWRSPSDFSQAPGRC